MGKEMDSDIKKMSTVELRQEVMRLRRAIKKWAGTYIKNGNERCHEVDESLANVIGVSLYASRENKKMTASEFGVCCDQYIARECRAGRLIDDRFK